MRSTVCLVVVLFLTGAVWAEPPSSSRRPSDRNSGYLGGPYSAYGPGLSYRQPTSYYGPYSVYGPGLTYRQPYAASRPAATSLSVQTSVSVPDGGEALVGGYSSASEGRNEFGAPGLGKTPYLGRGFRNVGSGRSVGRTTASVRVRIINLAEEEERQTGVKP